LEPFLEEVSASKDEVLHEEGENVLFAYFPCDGSLVSFSVAFANGTFVEAALIGKEGAAGGIISRGSVPAYARATVQLGGRFIRIGRADLERVKRRSDTITHTLALYSDCLVAQLLQGSACNATHTIEQRTAKLLLTAHDHTGAVLVPWTQDQLAGMLGVGRSYMTRVLAKLRASGAIATRRRMIRIQDPRALGRHCCGCQDVIRHHFGRVLNGIYPTASA
jgi:CRP-like cAMP-binding protein